jgi:hypothetical protein
VMVEMVVIVGDIVKKVAGDGKRSNVRG